MTASASDNTPEEKDEKPNVAELPSVFDILLYSLTLAKRYAGDVYGFTAYLLFPLILSFGVRGISGNLGIVAESMVNVLSLALSCWAAAAISTLISLKTAHPKKDHDPRSIGQHAASVLGTLLLASLLSGIIQAAGYFLLIVPGVIASILFAFTLEEVVLRGHGPISALAASKARVQHQLAAIGWRLLAIVFAFFLVYFILGAAVILVGSFATGISPTALALNGVPLWVDAILVVLQIALLPPVIIAHTVLYLSTSPTVD
ncbi:MAG: hypothetical protein AAB473_03465 [Patescibacteria group bacterium]